MNIKNNRKAFYIIAPVMGAMIFIFLLFLYLYRKDESHFLPKYITWNTLNETIDFDEEEVNILLKKKKLSISKDKELLYQTENDVFVSDVFCYDIDRDSKKEVLMLVWKRGSYGEHKPFWVNEDSTDYSQHIFIYRWDPEREDRLDPIWMSSDLGMNVVTISIDEYGRIHLTDNKGRETRWAWLHWGLVNCD